MNKYLIAILCLVLASSGASATDNQQGQKCFMRGTFVLLEFSFGPVLNDRIAGVHANSSYGTDVSVGYRLSHKFAVALGTGAHAYSNKTWTCGDTVPRKVENTCVPIYLRLRSDLMEREVSPYFQVDLGYSFMDIYSRDDMGRIKYAPGRFTNGRFEYITLDDSYIQYGNDGLFVRVDFGVSLLVTGKLRMNLGLSAGVHQSFLGSAFVTSSGEIMRFGRVDSLLSDSGSVAVRTIGKSDFIDSLESSFKVRLGFSF